jgi:hypothetical protein
MVIQFGTVTKGGTPLFSLIGLPPSRSPGESVTNAKVQLNQAATFPVSGTLTLGFNPYAGDSGLPSSGYIDPALQFLDGTGHRLGTAYTFTIPAQGTTVAIPEIDPGTVAGDITMTLTVEGQTQATSTITVAPSAPIVEPGSVQILNVSATRFDVELVANSSPRDVTYVNFTFTPASGAKIVGDTTFTFDVGTLLSSWFASNPGLSYGSAFSLTMPFQLSGPATAIQSVAVTVTNSVGTSAAVTGTK